MPFFSYRMGEILLKYNDSADAICFSNNGKEEPLPLLIHKKCSSTLLTCIKTDNFALHGFLEYCGAMNVYFETSECVNHKMLFNLNRSDDLKIWE